MKGHSAALSLYGASAMNTSMYPGAPPQGGPVRQTPAGWQTVEFALLADSSFCVLRHHRILHRDV
jgi:hypothetical protein